MLTFFGGEPLLNLPVMYYDRRAAVAARPRRAACRAVISIITNGLLLHREVVDRLLPFGLQRREDHARRRPRHPQPDAAAARRPGHLRPHRREHPPRRRQACRIAIGGNFDESSVDSYPALLEFLRAAGLRRQARQGQLQADRPRTRRRRGAEEGMLPLTPVDGATGKPLDGTCMTSAGAGRRLGLRLVRLRSTTRCRSCARRPSATASRRPTACTTARATCTCSTRTPSAPTARSTRAPGSPARRRQSTGHIDDRHDPWRESRARAVRPAQSVERMRRLRVHPGVCRRMPGRVALSSLAT